MKFNWTYIKSPNPDFPELYLLKTNTGESLRVEQNKFGSLVRLQLDGKNKSVQSVISNGVILREKDLISGRNISLNEAFSNLKTEISSLPKTSILRAIGGNYGIMTEFLGTAKVVQDKNHIKIDSWSDVVKLFNRYRNKIQKLPQKWRKEIKRSWQNKSFLPSLWDLFDISLFIAAGYGVYLLNFNLLQAGFITTCGAFFSGFADFLWRKKNIYATKIIILLVPGSYLLYLGYRFQ